MLKGKNLGEFEILVLTALVRLGPDAYGVSVRNEIETRTGRAVSVGALYAALGRLESKGLVSTRLGEATPERGGRAKKHYVIEAEGRRRLEQSLTALSRMTEGVLPWAGAKSKRGVT